MINEISIIIVTYNHEKFIVDCLSSLLNEDFLEIIVVDSKSTDNTVNLIESNFPAVKIIKNVSNRGYGAANNVAAHNSKGKYLIFLNPDTKVEKSAISKLIRPIEKDNLLITTPKILLYNGEKINTCGNKQHFTGMSFTRGTGEKPAERQNYRYVNGISGACFAIARENFFKLGCFDENIFLYMEDSELSWRIFANGLKILYVPEAIIMHDYNFRVNPEKIYHVERGRYIILRKYMSYKDYVFLSPSLLITEILTMGYAILNGFSGIKNKLKGMHEGLNVDVHKLNTDSKDLLKNMDIMLPKINFKYRMIFLILRKISNFIYCSNQKLMSLCMKSN